MKLAKEPLCWVLFANWWHAAAWIRRFSAEKTAGQGVFAYDHTDYRQTQIE